MVNNIMKLSPGDRLVGKYEDYELGHMQPFGATVRQVPAENAISDVITVELRGEGIHDGPAWMKQKRDKIILTEADPVHRSVDYGTVTELKKR